MKAVEVARLLQANPMFKGLPQDALGALVGAARSVAVEDGGTLIVEGERASSFFVVAEGTFVARMGVGEAGGGVEVGLLGPGDMVGEASLVGQGRRGATVTARGRAEAIEVDRDAFDALLQAHPQLLEGVTSVMKRRTQEARLRSLLDGILPPEGAQEIASKATWLHVQRGSAVFMDGDTDDQWYMVVDGWLGDFRAARRGEAGVLTGELRRGDTFGEIELVLNLPRTRTIRALRDTTLVRFSKEDFMAFTAKFPSVMMNMARRLLSRLAPRNKQPSQFPTLRIALIPVHPEVDIEAVGAEVEAAFGRIGASVARVSAQTIEEEVGVEGLRNLPGSDANWQRADLWLDRQGDRFSVIIVQGDKTDNIWTLRAGLAADQVIAVTMGDEPLDKKYAEKLLPRRGSKTTVGVMTIAPGQASEAAPIRRSLLALHSPTTVCPKGTRAWLDAVEAERAHHVRIGRSADYDRMARILGGRAVGLALGGGGARGLAHLGVHRALTEAGIEVDLVGGTSMGSIIASQLARGLPYDELIRLNKACVAVRAFSEYTVPMVALLKSTKIDTLAQMSGGDYDIDDLWTPFFAISADLTNAKMVIHEDGPVWRAIRASGSLPGIVLPVVHGQSLLVDGGIINNLPADVMRSRAGINGVVIGVNVSPETELAMRQEAFPSQWGLLGNAVLGRRDPEIPTILDVLMRSTVLSSIDRMTRVTGDMDLLLQPDMRGFGTLDFDKMDRIVEVGYNHACVRMDEIRSLVTTVNQSGGRRESGTTKGV